jgi:hypothetical protein
MELRFDESNYFVSILDPGHVPVIEGVTRLEKKLRLQVDFFHSNSTPQVFQVKRLLQMQKYLRLYIMIKMVKLQLWEQKQIEMG